MKSYASHYQATSHPILKLSLLILLFNSYSHWHTFTSVCYFYVEWPDMFLTNFLFLTLMSFVTEHYNICFELILQLKNYRIMGLVMAVEAAKIPTFRQELRSLIVET